VTITSSGGRVIATAILGPSHAKKIAAAGTTMTFQVDPWHATVPPESRYGLSAGTLPRYWTTPAELRRGLDLSC
jgi:hypothetical protein